MSDGPRMTDPVYTPQYRTSEHLDWTDFDFNSTGRERPKDLVGWVLMMRRLREEYPTCTFRLLRVEVID